MKKVFALLLAMALLLGAVPMSAIPVQATEVEEITEVAVVEETLDGEKISGMDDVPVLEEDNIYRYKGTYGEDVPSNEELFAGYAKQVLYGKYSTSGSVSANYGTAAGKRIYGDYKKMYDAIASIFKKIAAGKREYTVIALGQPAYFLDEDGELVYVEPDVEVDFSTSGADMQQADEEFDNLFSALLSDMPYEQYWHDKTSGFECWFGTDANDTVIYMEFSFYVADNYQGSSEFLVDTSKTGAASKAAANAKSIVNDYASKNDYEKLLAYKDKICKLVEYDDAAANGGYFAADDDPWQIIHVFDNDSSTNVVCEGYSKAFMYLCDLTEFNGDVTCYTVSGDAGGPHMWNIVTIGGKNYLVDVTNSEPRCIGQDGSLFMAGTSGSITKGYTFATSPRVTYTYDSETKALWGTSSSSILKLASSSFVPVDEPDAPVVEITNVASTGKPKISWNAVEGAVEYKIYWSRSKDSGYSRLATITKTSQINNSAKTGTQYYYYVVAVNDAGMTSAKSNKVTRTCDLPQPEIKVTNVASTGKNKITWEKVEGATEYKVYRATSKDGTYKRIYTTTGTSCTNSSAEAGKLYYYKVIAIHSNSAANSAYSEIVSRRCDLAQPKIKITNVESTGKNKITWEKVEGATEYKVYRATSKDGTYKRIYTTTGTSCTNSSAEAGKLYYYKVIAIHSNSAANSAYSEIVSRRCDLPRPTAKVALNSKGKPVVSWDAVEGAEKYTVYIYDADGELVKTATTTNLKQTHSSAVKGNTYSYRVVAVHSNTTANSAKSTAVSIKSK